MVLIWISVEESEPSTLTFWLKEKGQSCNLLGCIYKSKAWHIHTHYTYLFVFNREYKGA